MNLKKGEKINPIKVFFYFLIKIFLFSVMAVFLTIGFYFYNNRLFLFEAKILWPQVKFDANKFRQGNVNERASMAVDLIERKVLLGESTNLVSSLLGEPTGDYYHQDTNYTYRLTNKGEADWVLTFVSDDRGRVKKIFIRKSCCSISKKIVNEVLSLVPSP